MRGKIVAFLLLLSIANLLGCAAQKGPRTTAEARSFFRSKLPPTTLLILSEQFIEWHKGYNIQVRDHERGLLVTEWVSNIPSERYRISLRVSNDTEGSILSCHVSTEEMGFGKWEPLPIDTRVEGQLIEEIEQYVTSNSASAPH